MNTFNLGTFATLDRGCAGGERDERLPGEVRECTAQRFPDDRDVLLDTTATYTETTWLPNFHLTLRPMDFLKVRFAAYRALARPDFNMRLNKLVARITNPRKSVTAGNPRLKNAKAWNFEVNTSVFGNEIGLFTVSAFYRTIDDMFHTVSNIPGDYTRGNPGSILDTLGITWRPSMPVDAQDDSRTRSNSPKPTKVWGFEVEHQANLSFLPGLLSNIVLSYNLSIIRSETLVLSYRVDTTYVIDASDSVPAAELQLRILSRRSRSWKASRSSSATWLSGTTSAGSPAGSRCSSRVSTIARIRQPGGATRW